MHPIANHLIQLQELTLIRDEQRVAGRTDHLEQLNASIKQMTAELPVPLRVLFEKLQKRDPIAIAPVSFDNCAVCGMRMPISLIQAIRQGKDLQSCPNCARMLYIQEPAARRVGAKTRRSAPRKVGIARFSSEVLLAAHTKAKDKETVIMELAEKMQAGGYVDKADLLRDMALSREAILSTSVEDGLAFPHVRGVEGGGLTLSLATSEKGILFENSHRRTHVVFFIVIPTAASAFYLTLLSGLARTFGRDKNRAALLAESTDDGLWKALCKLTKTTVR